MSGNTNAPFGARPVGHVAGAPYNGQSNLYYVVANDGSAFHIGDFVKSAAQGDANGVPGIELAAGTDTVRGIVVGVLGVYPGVTQAGAALNLEQSGYVSATEAGARYVLVADEPDLVFEIQCGSAATNLVVTKLNNNFSLTVTAPSPTTNPISATIVDNSTIATTNTLKFKMLGLVRAPNNAVGAYQVVRAMFNAHELSGAAVAGV